MLVTVNEKIERCRQPVRGELLFICNTLNSLLNQNTTKSFLEAQRILQQTALNVISTKLMFYLAFSHQPSELRPTAIQQYPKQALSSEKPYPLLFSI